MSARRFAALDMGGTKIKGCVFEGDVAVQQAELDSEAKCGGAHFLSRGAQLLETFGAFDAVGISTAGQVEQATGRIRYANDNIPGYTGADVKGFFEGRFHRPVAVVNDVNAAALGEGACGAAMGETDYICLTYGTGIGGGVVLGGRLYLGAGASAGVMLGGLITHPEAVTLGDAFSGTYERYASTTALVARARAADASLADGRAIFSRLHEARVAALVDGWLDEISAGICALIHVYNVPCVVIGGGVMEQAYAIRGVQQRVAEHLIPGFYGARVLGAKLGNMAGLYGAKSLARALITEEV